MARTDKDRPDWVKENDVAGWISDEHNCVSYDRPCDLNDRTTSGNSHRLCDRIYDDERTFGRRWYNRVGRAERHHDFWAPHRGFVRSEMHRLTREAAAGYDVDAGTDLTDQHHRQPYTGTYWH